MRDLIGWHPGKSVLNLTPESDRSRDPHWRAGFEQLGRHSLSFETTCYDHQLGELIELATAYPDQPIILCHMGTPVAAGGPFGDYGHTKEEREATFARWREGMAKLAECPNVCVKLSGLAMPVCGFGWERRPTPPTVSELTNRLGPFVTFVIEHFGPERCMFASNFPVAKASMPLATLFDAYRSMAPGSEASLFRGTAERVYRIAPVSERG